MSINPTKLMYLRSTQPTSNTTTVPQPFQTPPPAYASHNSVAQMSRQVIPLTDEEAELSPVAISITSPVTVTGDGNHVSLDSADIASQIAQSIASALRETTMSSAGVPMIDENGRPRPIEVRVDATVKIEGNQNIVGEKAFQAGADITLKGQNKQNENSQHLQKMDDSQYKEAENGRKRQRAA